MWLLLVLEGGRWVSLAESSDVLALSEEARSCLHGYEWVVLGPYNKVQVPPLS